MKKVAFSGGEFQLNADRDGKAISLSGEAQSGRIDAVNEYNQKVQLTFNNLKTDGSSTLASFGERVGNQKLSLEKNDHFSGRQRTGTAGRHGDQR